MPFVQKEPPLFEPGIRPQPVPEPETQDIPFGEAVRAAFRRENSIGSIITASDREDTPEAFMPIPDKDFVDAFDYIDGTKYEAYTDRFFRKGIETKEDADALIFHIEQEETDNKILHDAGNMGVAAGLMAGVFDPINLVPIGGAASKAYTVGGSVLKGAARVGTAGFVAGSASEGVLQVTQETRSPFESAANIAASTFLSGALGAGAGYLGRADYLKLADKIERDMEVPPPNQSDRFEAYSIRMDDDELGKMAEQSVGAAETRQPTLAEETLENALGLQKGVARLNPLLRTLSSPISSVRSVAQGLAETPFLFKKNAEGMASPIAAETRVKMSDALLANAEVARRQNFKAYRKRVRADGGQALTMREFNEQVGEAAINLDTHPIPEVAATAQAYRSNLFEPMKNRAIEVGKLPENVKAKGADSYLTRVWDRDKIENNLPEFKAVVRGYLQGLMPDAVERLEKRVARSRATSAGKIQDLETLINDRRAWIERRIEDSYEGIEFPENVSRQDVETIVDIVTAPPKQPQRLSSFVRSSGGLRDEGGEISHMGGAERKGRLVNNKSGKTLDDMALEAWEAGYFPEFRERPSINDFLEKLRDDFSGYRPIFRANEGDDYLAKLDAIERNEQFLNEIGIDANDFLRRMRDPLMDVRKLEGQIDKMLRAASREREKGADTIAELEAELTELLERPEQYIDDIVDKVIYKITSNAAGRTHYDMTVNDRGIFKGKTFDIPDAQVGKFVERDIQRVAAFYKRTMASDTELHASFGDSSMTSVLGDGTAEKRGKLWEDYQRLIDVEEDVAKRKQLIKRRDRDIRDVAAMRDRLRGTYGMAHDPDTFFPRFGRALREVQFLSKLGGMTASAIPDVARPVMVNGLSRVIGSALVPMITNFKTFKLAAREVKQAGTALDAVLSTRAYAIADITDPLIGNTRVERGIDYLARNYGNITLMNPWNTGLKQFSGVVTQNRILNAVMAAGRKSEKDATYLRSLGIDEGIEAGIRKMYREHGMKDGGLYVANTNAWDNVTAREAFRAAIVKEVDKTIVTPGIGDRPLWMSGEMGKMVGQFKSFAFASVNRTTIAGLQQRDAAMLNGVIAAVALGMMAYAFKQWDAGRELADNPETWIAEGIDRSGLLGIFSDVNNTAESFTGGAIGMNRITGAAPMSRYASRNAVGALLGPTIGTVSDVATIGTGLSQGWTAQDTRALRRVLPYQNLLFMRQLMDQAETGVNNFLGVPERRK